MERSFKKEIESLKLGDGDTFHGEGILAVTKALLQSGVSYVGGYQGAPISHLMDVLADAEDILNEYGVHFEANASEASAAAMLGASINYPLRGAVTWKSTVGTNVASDALSNLASAGVIGGALIIIGEDYGEGASIMQERSHAFAMKSSMWLLDPRPNLPSIVDMVEKGFELSEISNTPVMLELRIRACHVFGRFACKDNVAPKFSRHNPIRAPASDVSRIILPPATYAQEKHKFTHRLPAAMKFIVENGLNEVFEGDQDDVGIIMQGGMYNTVQRALNQLGLADIWGNTPIPQLVLNVTYPLIPDQIASFCAGKKAVLVVEESQPDFIEQAINAILRKADVDAKVIGKDVLPMAGEYTSEVMLAGLKEFFRAHPPRDLDIGPLVSRAEQLASIKERAAELLGDSMPARPPTFCTGCPERPAFSALKMVERELGPTHVSADIGCHSFATLAPFNVGNSILGYGLSLASSSGVAPAFNKRVISVMGDGGFWHNGLASGVSSAVFNEDDSVLIIMDNGYSAATGGQYLPSSNSNLHGRPTGMSMEGVLESLGVRWLRKVSTYDIAAMVKTLREAMTTDEGGLKVIIAHGECMLAQQRRMRPAKGKRLAAGRRVIDERFGVDEDVCTGDRSCIRLSGCPSLTIKDNPDPLRTDPVAHVDQSCVGCGVCGDVAHVARLCPSFYRAQIIRNPTTWDRAVNRLRRLVIGALESRPAAKSPLGARAR